MTAKEAKQSIFDEVLAHMRAQRKKSISCISCAYRGKDGAKCAIGCLIPDEMYKYAFEGHDIYADELQDVVTYLGVDKQFLDHLQRCHDRCDRMDKFMEDFEENMKHVAHVYELEYKI